MNEFEAEMIRRGCPEIKTIDLQLVILADDLRIASLKLIRAERAVHNAKMALANAGYDFETYLTQHYNWRG